VKTVFEVPVHCDSKEKSLHNFSGGREGGAVAADGAGLHGCYGNSNGVQGQYCHGTCVPGFWSRGGTLHVTASNINIT
jgi:hypothetical protein